MKQTNSDLTNETRWACANAAFDLRDLLANRNGMSVEVQREIIQEALTALEMIPPPDDQEYGN